MSAELNEIVIVEALLNETATGYALFEPVTVQYGINENALLKVNVQLLGLPVPKTIVPLMSVDVAFMLGLVPQLETAGTEPF